MSSLESSFKLIYDDMSFVLNPSLVRQFYKVLKEFPDKAFCFLKFTYIIQNYKVNHFLMFHIYKN